MGPLSPFPHLQQKLWAPERPSQHPKCSPCPGDTAPAPGDTVWTGDPSPKPLSPQPPPRSAAPPAPCRPPGGHFCVPPGVPKTLLVPFGHRCCSSGRGGARPELPGVSTRGSPNVTKSARPRAPIIVASGRRDMGGPMGTGTPLSPLPGALPPEKKKALPAAPNPVQPHGQGENPCVFPTSCLEHPQISSLFFWGFSQPKPSVRKEQLPSKHRVKGVIGLN